MDRTRLELAAFGVDHLRGHCRTRDVREVHPPLPACGGGLHPHRHVVLLWIFHHKILRPDLQRDHRGKLHSQLHLRGTNPLY